MHEMSIAEALLAIARERCPAGSMLLGVAIEAGPMRGIDPDAMQFAWQAVAGEQIALQMTMLPWRMKCDDCERFFNAAEPLEKCACGSERTHPVGGDELRLIAIDVDERSPTCAFP